MFQIHFPDNQYLMLKMQMFQTLLMHVDIINAKCFRFLVFFQLMLQQLLPYVSKTNYKYFRINVSESAAILFTIQCFRIKKYQCFPYIFFGMLCLIFFSQHFFCSHRHDCRLYTMLYIESWNGKKMETALQPVIAATY
jgi:hypothetical protein